MLTYLFMFIYHEMSYVKTSLALAKQMMWQNYCYLLLTLLLTKPQCAYCTMLSRTFTTNSETRLLAPNNAIYYHRTCITILSVWCWVKLSSIWWKDIELRSPTRSKPVIREVVVLCVVIYFKHNLNKKSELHLKMYDCVICRKGET